MEHYSVLQNEQTQKGNGKRNVVETRSKEKKKRKENSYRNLIKLRVKCNRIVLLVCAKEHTSYMRTWSFCLFVYTISVLGNLVNIEKRR